MFNLKSTVIFISLLGKASLDSAAGEPPYLPSERDWQWEQVVDGEDKTLRCPVDTVDTRMYRWYHGQTEISDTFQPDYQLQGRRLLIRSFSARLKGKYTCKGVNGFGSASYSFILSVGGAPDLEDVLVDGVMEDVAVSVGDNASFTCKVQSQHSSLSVVWARRLQADQRMVPDTTFGLLHIGEDLYKRLEPSSEPRLEVSDKFLLEVSGPRYQHSLQIVEVSMEDADQYVCAVFRRDTLLDHQSAVLKVTSPSPAQPSLAPKRRSPADFTIVLAVLGSVVLLLLTVLLTLLCGPSHNKVTSSLASQVLTCSLQTVGAKQKRNIPPFIRDQRVQNDGDLANFI